MPRPYAPRNVINAAQIKSRIIQRSYARNDPRDITHWLKKHFFRQAIGNFEIPAPGLQSVTSVAQASELLGDALPPWIHAQLAEHTQLWWLDPDSEALCTLENNLVEFLASRQGTALEGKLMRINCPQALALSLAEHSTIQMRLATGTYSHHPEATRTILQGASGIFVELIPESEHFRAEMAYESQIMRHCLGMFADRKKLTGGYGEHYASACEEGRCRIFSYRRGPLCQPKVTISAYITDGGFMQIEQIKGKQNRPPVTRYHEDVKQFLNECLTSPNTPADALSMSIVRTKTRWLSFSEVINEEEQLDVLNHYPEVALHFPLLTRTSQWLLAAKSPELLSKINLDAPIAEALGIENLHKERL